MQPYMTQSISSAVMQLLYYELFDLQLFLTVRDSSWYS